MQEFYKYNVLKYILFYNIPEKHITILHASAIFLTTLF